jgi:hypothetical protein
MNSLVEYVSIRCSISSHITGHMMEGLWGGQTDMTAAMAHYK